MQLWLVGCAAQGPLQGPAALQFEVTGKLAVRNGAKGQSLRFNWRQYPRNYAIQVWGPLGQGRVLLHGTTEFMTVERGDDVVAAGSPDEVMLAHLGWRLPVEVLSRWIRGEPHPLYKVTEQDQNNGGELAAFSQAGWQVQLSGWQQRDNRRTPARIVAVREDVETARKITVAVKTFREGV